MRPNREYFWRDRLYNYAIKSAAATFKRSTSFIRERYIVSVSSNFLTQISCGIKTKCRKTRAMQRDFTIVDSLALRQCNTSMIPDTHSLKLLFPTRYTSRSIYLPSWQSALFCRFALTKKRLIKLSTLKKLHPNLKRAPIHISMNQSAFYILTDEALTKSLL